jgi:vacuolar-type H+-ATPase subunit H
VSETREQSVNGALGSVRQLEGALEATSATRAASQARLEEARADASRLLAAARDDAAAAAAERRRVVLGAAEDDAAEISRQGKESAARLLADAWPGSAAAVEAALALILPAAGTGEA